VGIAAWCHGIGRGALEESIAYVRERRRVPGPAVRAMESTLAEMAMRLEAGRVLLCRAAYLKDTGRPFRSPASMAKLVCSEAAGGPTIHEGSAASPSGAAAGGVAQPSKPSGSGSNCARLSPAQVSSVAVTCSRFGAILHSFPEVGMRKPTRSGAVHHQIVG